MGFPTLNDAARRVATVFEKWNCLIESCLPVERERPKKIEPYGPFAAVSLLEYGGLKPILPFHGVPSDAACRVVVKRMCEEHFNHALPVLGLMRFFCREASAAFFLPLAGACGLEGFWAWACARDSHDARVRAEGQGGRSVAGKSPASSPGASFLSPLSLAIQRKGARGRRGRAAPEARRGLFCVWRYGRGKTYMNDSALLGRTLGGGRATLGPHLPAPPLPRLQL